MRLSPPWPDGYTINKNSPYGWRIHPISKVKKFHHGVDVALPNGTELVAPADGVVAHKGSGASGGNTLIIKHADDLYTVYYHLKKPSMLKVGAEVRSGQLIAYSGNTGASTGPHLHFETRRSKKWGDTFDPLEVLDFSEDAPVVVSKNDFEQLAEAIEKPQEAVSASVAPAEAKSVKPSLLGRVAPSLAVWQKSWEARGKKR